jgi:hypothetical protein
LPPGLVFCSAFFPCRYRKRAISSCIQAREVPSNIPPITKLYQTHWKRQSNCPRIPFKLYFFVLLWQQKRPCGPKLQHHRDDISSNLQYADNSCEHHCRLGYLSILPYNGTLTVSFPHAARREGISKGVGHLSMRGHPCFIAALATAVTAHFFRALEFTDNVHSRS